MAAEKITVKTLLTCAVLILAIEFLMGGVTVQKSYNRLVVLAVARILETAGILLTLIYLGNGLGSIGLNAKALKAGMMRGAVWTIGFGVAALMAGLVIYLCGTDPLQLIASGLPKKFNEKVVVFIVGGFIGPVAEEVFFRGICYNFFRKWGMVAAVVFTTIFFVLAHSIRSTVPLPQIVGGVLFAVAYEIEKNLVVPITIHIAGNLAIFTLSALV